MKDFAEEINTSTEEAPTLHFPELQLDFLETRVLGALLEKEATTPAYYPMTLNGLESACNQSSNRNPITEIDEVTLEETLQRLRDKKLALLMHVAGSRVPKYSHQLHKTLELTSPEIAVLTVLLLRGIQTAGEIKQRTERIHSFENVDQVEETLQSFIEYGNGPLVKEIPAGHGRRVKTYAHLLGGEPGLLNLDESAAIPVATASVAAIVEQEEQHWKSKLEATVQSLQDELASVRQELVTIKAELGIATEPEEEESLLTEE